MSVKPKVRQNFTDREPRASINKKIREILINNRIRQRGNTYEFNENDVLDEGKVKMLTSGLEISVWMLLATIEIDFSYCLIRDKQIERTLKICP